MNGRRLRSVFRGARILAAVGLVFAVSVPPAGAAGSITGGGSSFAALEFAQWTADVSSKFGLKVDYTAQGSGFGRTAFLTGQLFYGASDIELQAEDQQTFNNSGRQEFVYVPTTAGGLAMAYHVTGTDGSRIRNIRANQRNVCRLLTEEGMYWDDPELASENPGVPLPHQAVLRGQRAESAGESFLFSQFCIATAPDVWGRFVQLAATTPESQAAPELLAGKPTSRWPANTPSGTGYYNGADNLANGIASGDGSIAFMAFGYANVKSRNIPVISVKNTAGVYLQPNPQNVSIALTYAIPQDNGTFKLNYVANNPDAYFPSTYSYVLAPKAKTDPGDGNKLATFLNYSVTYGQLSAERLGYCRLSREVIALSIAKIAQIPGAPPAPPPTDWANPPGAPITSGNTPGLAAKGATNNQAAAAMLRAAAAKQAAASGAAGAAEAEAAATAAATDAAAAESADGIALGGDQLDMSKIAKGAAPVRASVISDNVSNADTVWYFLLGFGLIAIGLGIGSVSAFRDRGESS